ncbi:MAG: adenosylcobalamin-dependent ribonucleoside-diphosphate reductase [Thaumarchaeota archaeon]|nr:adenosylcobalamin-dependent ribonucleoside-diphosphate reductase [Nitrososphaerota archaeon]
MISEFGLNALQVLQRRYLLRDENSQIIESPAQLFRRVAKAIAQAELNYEQNTDVNKIEDEFFEMMSNLEFLPNTPTLMNAGTKMGQLAACFVVPVEDSLNGIFDAAKSTALIHQSGGGTGFSFSKLRPQGDFVKSVDGRSSGPIAFMTIFDKTTEVIKQGGKRRGANMGILRIEHPDILDFIQCKSKEGFLSNFNISVAVTDSFMSAVKKNQNYNLINPRTNKVTQSLSARNVFDLIVYNAWKTGDPGLIFIDEINRHNPTPQLGAIDATNPCGEMPLLYWEACNLGSINLAKIVENKKINWAKLKKLVNLSVRFLDNVIDVNKYPVAQIEKITKLNRKIGLGIMGFAEALILLDIPYNSNKALSLAQKLMKFIKKEGYTASHRLGLERGSFANFEQSIWKKKMHYDAMRNATVTTIAPTGTISIIANCSSGIEPLFAISYIRNVMDNTELLESNPYFENIAKKDGFYSKRLIEEISRHGTIQHNKTVPKKIRQVFVTAHDISPFWHIKMQAAFQKYTDNAVSKTINLPHNAKQKDVNDAFWLAYNLNCKGITVYRYGSKSNQILSFRQKTKQGTKTVADSEFSGGCIETVCPH